jgi:hypothetical protein
VHRSSGNNQTTPILAPRQLEVGIKGGAEALAHAARRFLAGMSNGQVLVKLDFSNAFNSLRRDAMLEAAAKFIPDLLPYIISAYGSPSTLCFGNEKLESLEGIQQGDPLGPLLFCITIHKVLQSIKSTFVSGYLDDVGIGGDVQSVVEDIQLVEFEATRLGLRLNHSKCEIIGLDISSRVTLTRAGLCFQECLPSSATLLGTPIHVDGIDRAIRDRLASLELAVPRLKKLSSHEALFLLRNSLAMPKLQYLLRTAPCFLSSVTT